MPENISFKGSVSASKTLLTLSSEITNSFLVDLAEEIVKRSDYLLEENQKDLDRMDPSDYKYDRLKLSLQRIRGIAEEMRHVSALPEVIGNVLSHNLLPNGLETSRISVPIGVIGVIYEARPNVTFDVFSLCFKTRNAVVLKGGSDAHFSNIAAVNIIRTVLEKYNIDINAVFLMPSERTAMSALMEAVGEVDLIIPRGSQQLIDFVRKNAKVPVIETGAGIVHTYFDESADLKKAKLIIHNAKTRRVSVCNALDCLIINENRLGSLPALVEMLAEAEVSVYADEKSFEVLSHRYPDKLLNRAGADSFGTEFLDYKIAIKTVSSLDEALQHIANYSSKHSEAILSDSTENIYRFLNEVDAAAVYVNTSTAFTDGAQFGLGAEVGISTQKIHARGPMGLEALTSYKWIVRSDGQIRVS